MISNQLLQKTIDKIKEITQMDLAVLNLDGDVCVRTFTSDKISPRRIQDFVRQEGETGDAPGFLLFRVKDDLKDEYVLAVKGEDDQTQLVGAMAKYQLETLLVAYKERFDKDNFFKSLLMDNMLTVDMFDRAKKLHIELEAFRSVIIITSSSARHDDMLSATRNVFAGNNEDFVTAVNNRSVYVVKKVEAADSYPQLDAISKRILNSLSRDGVKNVRIAFGSIVSELKDVSRSCKEADLAMDVSNIFFEERVINSYRRLDIGRLIYQLPMPLCKLFIKEIFGDVALEEFDEETITTINKFFDNSLNVSETSRQLYIHRNTLVYRLDKIQKLTGLDLRIFDDAITFKIALMVSKYMNYIEEKERNRAQII